jgi:hypothetical protein
MFGDAGCYRVSAVIGSNRKVNGFGTGIPFIQLYLGRYPMVDPEIRLCADELMIQQGDVVFSPVPHVSLKALEVAHWEGDCIVVPPSTSTNLDALDWGSWFWIDLTGSRIDWSAPVMIRYVNKAWFEESL